MNESASHGRAASPINLWHRLTRFMRELGPSAGRDLVAILLHHLDVDSDGIELVKSMRAGNVPHAEATERMRDIEHEGDDLRADLVAALGRALVTPIDREDLYRLSRSIDQVLDGLRDFVREWDLFNAHDAQALSRVLDALAVAVHDTRSAVQSIVESPEATSPQIITAQRSANRVRLVHEDEIAALFGGEFTMRTLRQRELLHRLDAIGMHLVSAVHIVADAFVKRGE